MRFNNMGLPMQATRGDIFASMYPGLKNVNRDKFYLEDMQARIGKESDTVDLSQGNKIILFYDDEGEIVNQYNIPNATIVGTNIRLYNGNSHPVEVHYTLDNGVYLATFPLGPDKSFELSWDGTKWIISQTSHIIQIHQTNQAIATQNDSIMVVGDANTTLHDCEVDVLNPEEIPITEAPRDQYFIEINVTNREIAYFAGQTLTAKYDKATPLFNDPWIYKIKNQSLSNSFRFSLRNNTDAEVVNIEIQPEETVYFIAALYTSSTLPWYVRVNKESQVTSLTGSFDKSIFQHYMARITQYNPGLKLNEIWFRRSNVINFIADIMAPLQGGASPYPSNPIIPESFNPDTWITIKDPNYVSKFTGVKLNIFNYSENTSVNFSGSPNLKMKLAPIDTQLTEFLITNEDTAISTTLNIRTNDGRNIIGLWKFNNISSSTVTLNLSIQDNSAMSNQLPPNCTIFIGVSGDGTVPANSVAYRNSDYKILRAARINPATAAFALVEVDELMSFSKEYYYRALTKNPNFRYSSPWKKSNSSSIVLDGLSREVYPDLCELNATIPFRTVPDLKYSKKMEKGDEMTLIWDGLECRWKISAYEAAEHGRIYNITPDHTISVKVVGDEKFFEFEDKDNDVIIPYEFGDHMYRVRPIGDANFVKIEFPESIMYKTADILKIGNMGDINHIFIKLPGISRSFICDPHKDIIFGYSLTTGKWHNMPENTAIQSKFRIPMGKDHYLENIDGYNYRNSVRVRIPEDYESDTIEFDISKWYNTPSPVAIQIDNETDRTITLTGIDCNETSTGNTEAGRSRVFYFDPNDGFRRLNDGETADGCVNTADLEPISPEELDNWKPSHRTLDILGGTSFRFEDQEANYSSDRYSSIHFHENRAFDVDTDFDSTKSELTVNKNVYAYLYVHPDTNEVKQVLSLDKDKPHVDGIEISNYIKVGGAFYGWVKLAKIDFNSETNLEMGYKSLWTEEISDGKIEYAMLGFLPRSVYDLVSFPTNDRGPENMERSLNGGFWIDIIGDQLRELSDLYMVSYTGKKLPRRIDIAATESEISTEQTSNYFRRDLPFNKITRMTDYDIEHGRSEVMLDWASFYGNDNKSDPGLDMTNVMLRYICNNSN